MSFKDSIPLGFGKYKGRTPDSVADENPGYICWLYENVSKKIVSRELYVACEMDVRESEEDMKDAYDSYADDWGDKR